MEWHIDNQFQLYNAEGRAKMRMYPPPYNGGYATPWLWVDGKNRGYQYSLWAGFVSENVTAPTPVNLGIFGDYNGSTRTGTVQAVIENDSSAEINAWVSVVVTEDSCNYTGPNGDPWHNHVCRDYIPDQSGTVVTVASGAADTIELPFTLQAEWNEARCKLVVYVQSTTMLADSSYPALQGAERNVLDMVGIEDAGRVMPGLFRLGIAPNPCRGRAQLRFEAPAGSPYRIGLYSTDGRLVREFAGTAAGPTAVTFDAGDLPRGVFLCRLSTPAGEAATRLLRVD